MTSSPAILVDGATKRFGGTSAFDALTLRIPPGQFVAIVGRSGAGKTTLLRCLATAATVSTGTIRVGDDDLASLHGRALRDYRRRVGMIYQHFNLVKRLSVASNVLVGRLGHVRGLRAWLALCGRFDADDRRIALRCLAHVGLLEKAWQRADTLSGGEQQRVAIARMLAQDPAMVLADEPVASLDVLNGALVMETLRRVATDAGLTVISTLHHVEYARRYADRVIGLRQGRIVFDGAPVTLTDAALVEIFGELPRALAESDSVAVPVVARLAAVAS